ncbi:hypothetical protein FKM82_023565 [Ascaphus truei]
MGTNGGGSYSCVGLASLPRREDCLIGRDVSPPAGKTLSLRNSLARWEGRSRHWRARSRFCGKAVSRVEGSLPLA